MLFTFVSLFTIVANTLIGGAVFFRAPKEKTNQKFAILSLCLIGWIGTVFLYYTFQQAAAVALFGRLTFVFAAFIPAAMYLFVVAFPRRMIHIPHWVDSIVILHALFLAVLSVTPLIDAKEVIRDGVHTAMYGPVYPYYLLSLIAVSLVSIGILVRKLTKATLTTRTQLQFLLLGFISLTVIAVLFSGILPGIFKITTLDPFGSLGTVVFLGFISYAIIRHRFMDINRFAAGVGVYASAIVGLGAIYFVIAYFIGQLFFSDHVHLPYILVTVIAIMAFKYAISPLRSYFWKSTNRFFYNNIYDREELFNEVSEVVVSSLYLDILVEKTLQIFKQQFLLTRTAFIGIEEEKAQLIHFQNPKTYRLTLAKDEISLIGNIHEITQINEIENNALRRIFHKKNIQLVIPVTFGKRSKGFFCFGEKKSGAPYSDFDVQTLELILPTISIALQNASSIEKIKGFNRKLKREIDKATKSLRLANDRLRSADKLKDEFISIASHELKTPTTAIQGFLWLILQKDKKMSPYSREKLEKVMQLTHHTTALVNDMLDVSKIESKRISLHPEPFNLSYLAEEIKGELAVFAIEKNIAVSLRNGKKYTVFADKGRARQIFSNLLNNALKYTPDGGRIFVDFKRVDHKVEVTVKDTGIGIRKSDFPKLFTKFGKLEDGNSVSSHLPGSGLGLYITKNFVELSGGEIDVVSQYGKGSTFTFSLPVPQ